MTFWPRITNIRDSIRSTDGNGELFMGSCLVSGDDHVLAQSTRRGRKR
jgi:hypothetical protein